MRYIFNTSGQYVAFIYGNNLFGSSGNWIGFIIGNEVYNARDGSFLGYLSSDDRIVRRINELPHIPRFIPIPPLRPLPPIRPLRRLRMLPLSYPWMDIFEQ